MKHLRARRHVNFINCSEDSRCQLGSERIHAIILFLTVGLCGNLLLVVHFKPGNQILRDSASSLPRITKIPMTMVLPPLEPPLFAQTHTITSAAASISGRTLSHCVGVSSAAWGPFSYRYCSCCCYRQRTPSSTTPSADRLALLAGLGVVLPAVGLPTRVCCCCCSLRRTLVCCLPSAHLGCVDGPELQLPQRNNRECPVSGAGMVDVWGRSLEPAGSLSFVVVVPQNGGRSRHQ